MYYCSSEVLAFFKDRVVLPEEMKSRLRDHRKANEDRVLAGLKEMDLPKPRFIKQGSYAMHTMVQNEQNDFDIDDGIVFLASDLIGPRGGEVPPLQARQLICDALQNDTFKEKPKVHNNCVRIIYADGYHIDMPVYREVIEKGGESHYELASAEWKLSDPEAVTKWFVTRVADGSPDDADGRQMRRIVRLLKYFSKSRPSWNMPSGFILSVLVDERYVPILGHDDESFVATLKGIVQRLGGSLSVGHPVLAEMITKGTSDPCMVEALERFQWADEQLAVLYKADCTKKAALQAWKKVFDTDYFNGTLDEVGKGGLTLGGGQPADPVSKRGGGNYGV